MNALRTLWKLLLWPAWAWRTLRARLDANAHGQHGAHLREAVRNLKSDEVHEARTAFGLKFLKYSNRSRARWLAENGISVPKSPGRTMRQDQQLAALDWFDNLHGKEVRR